MRALRVLDLFSGIGGFSLGLERAGMRTVAFCEIEPYARRVLAKHWPEVPCYDDVRTLTAARLAADGIAADVICGGFPCQGISAAGKGEGLDDPRSGLWREYARLIGELRPDWVIVENSPRLRTRGADRVFGDLEALGYAWGSAVVGAAHAGAPHRRERVWILAHANGQGKPQPEGRVREQRGWACDCGSQFPSNANEIRRRERAGAFSESAGRPEPSHGCQVLPDADGAGLEVEVTRQAGQCPTSVGGGGLPDHAMRGRHGASHGAVCPGRHAAIDAGWWAAEPAVGRMAHGVPNRVDRIAALGNAVVPQIVEIIGKAILQAEGRSA